MSKFAEFCTRYFKQYFELHPTDAIYYGVEGYDHLLNDYSDKSYKAEKIFVKESLRKLREISPADLSADEAIDYALLEGRLTLQSYEQAKEDYRLKQPDIYSPIEAIYILTVRATNDLGGNLISRLNRAPALIQRGITNLSRKDANPPKLWTENAIEGAKGGIAFLDSLPKHPKVQSEVKDSVALRRAISVAKTAMNDFANYLENHLLPRSNGSYAVGAEHFNLLLKKKHFLEHDAQGLLALGESLFVKTKLELEGLAGELAPGKGVEAAARAIQENHPSSEQILAAYDKAMSAARDFTREKNS